MDGLFWAILYTGNFTTKSNSKKLCVCSTHVLIEIRSGSQTPHQYIVRHSCQSVNERIRSVSVNQTSIVPHTHSTSQRFLHGMATLVAGADGCVLPCACALHIRHHVNCILYYIYILLFIIQYICICKFYK